ELRIAQEFIRRYVEFMRPLPRAASTADRVMLKVQPHAGYIVDAITVHHETFPKSMTAKLANDITSYSLPEKRREYLPRLHDRVERTAEYTREVREEYADGRRGDFEVAAACFALSINCTYVCTSRSSQIRKSSSRYLAASSISSTSSVGSAASSAKPRSVSSRRSRLATCSGSAAFGIGSVSTAATSAE